MRWLWNGNGCSEVFSIGLIYMHILGCWFCRPLSVLDSDLLRTSWKIRDSMNLVELLHVLQALLNKGSSETELQIRSPQIYGVPIWKKKNLSELEFPLMTEAMWILAEQSQAKDMSMSQD